MSPAHLKYSAAAFAVMQAFAFPAHAETAADQAVDQPAAIPEVVVKGARPVGADRASIGGFGEASVLQTPVSITVIDQQKLQDFSIRNATEAMSYDASVSDAYNAVGYAENFSIRGFVLDNTSSYRKDGWPSPATPRSRWRTRNASKY